MTFEEIVYSAAGGSSKKVYNQLLALSPELLIEKEIKIKEDMIRGFEENSKFPSYNYLCTTYGQATRKCHNASDIYNALRDLLKGRESEKLKNDASKILLSDDPEEIREGLSDVIRDRKTSSVKIEMMESYKDEYKEDFKNIGKFTFGVKPLEEITGGFLNGLVATVAAWTSHGKALRETTLVYTPNGTKSVESVQVGDRLIGSDGLPTKVTGVYLQGEKEVFRVNFDDKTFVDCCEDHLWETQDDKERRRKGYVSSIRTTKEVKESLIVMRGGVRRNHSVKQCDIIQFENKILKIDPYVMGLYLSDGSWGDQISLGLKEKDVFVRVKNSITDTLKHHTRMFYRVGNYGKISEFKKDLQSYGLKDKKSWNKFIPTDYLYNSEKDRIDLLRGLCDGDGSLCKDYGKSCRVEYSTVSILLAYNILELVRGLGLYAKLIKVKNGSYIKNGEKVKCRLVYRILFRGDLFNPFFMKRKSKDWIPKVRNRRKFIVSVDKLGKKALMRCFTVDSKDSLFLVEGHNLTHNSTAWNNAIYINAMEGKKIAVFSMEIPKTMVYTIFLTRHSYEYGKKIIPYERVFEGKLTKQEEDFLYGELEKDFHKKLKKAGGQIVIMTTEDLPTFSKENIWGLYKEIEKAMGGLDYVVWDHVNLFNYLDPDKWITGDFCIQVLSTIAKNYRTDQGTMIGTGLAAQVNREGWKKAIKAEGRYNMLALSEFHELERSSTYVVFLYADSYMMNMNELKLQLVKHRIGRVMTDPVVTYIKPECAVVGDSYNTAISTTEGFSDMVDDFLNEDMDGFTL